MVGRKVRVRWALPHEIEGVVVKHEPLGAGMCDVLVRFGGNEVWYASSQLVEADGLGPLPDRRQLQRQAGEEALRTLRVVLNGLVQEWHKPWRGCEHGKALVGQMLTGAIAELEKKG